MSRASKVSHQAATHVTGCSPACNLNNLDQKTILAGYYQDRLPLGTTGAPTFPLFSKLPGRFSRSLVKIWRPLLAGLLGGTLVLTGTSWSSAERESGSGFLATWKLLSQQEKQQFIAGYLQGWRDAAKVTDIAIAYVRTNPSEAVAGLERIKELYNLEGLKPPQVVNDIDLYYSDPDNYEAPLSRAVTASQQARQR